jgi:hypothetical protein
MDVTDPTGGQMQDARPPHRARRLAFAIGALAASLAAFAPAAQAGPLVAAATDCDAQTLSQPFLPWLDPAHYTLAPNGGFEQGASDWDLDGGASVVSGNESFYVREAGDRHSLSLPAGSSATSDVVCVGVEHPTLRIFARNTGSPLSSLKVEVLFEDATGAVRSAPIGALSAGPSWQPSALMPLVVNLLPLLPGEATPVAFRFEPQGAGGQWRLDDVYVDPLRRS